MNKTLYLIRHCKAEGQEPSAKLTDEGKEQAVRLADFLADQPINRILSSPYERAISTAAPLARRKNVNIHTDVRLSERVLSSENMADWMEKLKESFVDLERKLPGGESSKEAMTRGIAVISELAERPDQRIAIVTHGNLMSLILKHFDCSFGFAEWKGLTNPDVYELTLSENHEVKIKRIWK